MAFSEHWDVYVTERAERLSYVVLDDVDDIIVEVCCDVYLVICSLPPPVVDCRVALHPLY